MMEITLALVILNLMATFIIIFYLFYANNSLNSKITSIDKKLHGHFEWHRGTDDSS